MTKLRKAVIFDCDGTLCDVSSIRHFVSGENRDFHSFHMASAGCPPHAHVVEAAHQAKADDLDVLVVTARMQQYRNVTAMWLALHGVPSDALFMRADGDFRKDFFVKKDILRRIRARWDVMHAWDDNPNVLELWRQESIPCTVVPGWDS
jgi:phosphoglycolate phosphatase-like HAD superfamily hydrolase